MNNQEAIKAMHNLNMVLSITPSEREAVNMAIAALEEQQSRREWYQKGYADGKKDAEMIGGFRWKRGCRKCLKRTRYLMERSWNYIL